MHIGLDSEQFNYNNDFVSALFTWFFELMHVRDYRVVTLIQTRNL